jgi:hypothetical protein
MAMMDEMVRQVAERTGLPEDKALAAARAAVDFLDDRLPPPVGGHLKSLLAGEGGGGGLGGLGDAAGKLGGLFGR